MATYQSKIVEFEGRTCIVFSDDMCRDMNIKAGDDVDIAYKEECLIVKLLK